MPHYETLQLDKQGRIATITINRPDKRNALNIKTREEGAALLEELRQDDTVGVVVFTGAGDKAFIAGADIAEFAGRTSITQRDVMMGRSLFTAIDTFPKPVIAMINGYCLGGGCATCSSQFKTLLGKMGTAGVKDVIYTRYPEPGNPPGSNASLKACLDATMPNMQTVCEGSTSPKCHIVDLRPVWVNGDTSDGLHPTQSGGDHVGDLIWSKMVEFCFAQ